MSEDYTVDLAAGVWHAGTRHATARLRALTGSTEIALAETEPLPAAQVTTVLAEVVSAIGALAPVEVGHIRALSIGDRERLLLSVYARSFGSRIDTLLVCTTCREWIEVPISLTALLSTRSTCAPAQERQLTVASWTIGFRVLNGADHERAARLAHQHTGRGLRALRAASITEVRDNNGAPVDLEALPPAVYGALEEALRDVDPLAEISVSVHCPACGTEGAGVIDSVALLLAELGGPERVFADVACLARAFHWTENVILALPTARRRLYASLVERTEVAA